MKEPFWRFRPWDIFYPGDFLYICNVMIEIREIQQPVAKLYKSIGKEFDESRDIFVGTVTDYAQYLDVRLQIKTTHEKGYYMRFNDDIIYFDSNGTEDHIPGGFFGELEIDLLLDLV